MGAADASMRKPRILFIDVTCPKPYDYRSLVIGGLGGSEATCVRIAEGLASRGYPVTVSQHLRVEEYRSSNDVLYNGLVGAKTPADVVIVLRQPQMMEFIYKHYRGSKRMLWLHDMNVAEVIYEPDLHRLERLDIVCVSDWHTMQVKDAFLTIRPKTNNVRVYAVKNPIDDSLKADDTPVDKHKLVFFSSPHKGLDRALYLFSRLRSIDSQFTLHVANPGYYPDAVTDAPGVTLLGALSHAEVLQHVRSSLAVFHCNSTFPETFGLVYAEAHAVGTPCLTANLGAVREILSREEMIDVSDERSVVEKVCAWRDGERPSVALPDGLRLSCVIDEWERRFRE